MSTRGGLTGGNEYREGVEQGGADLLEKNLMKLGMPQWQAYRNRNTRKGYWALAGSGILTRTITNERLARAGSAGYYSILNRYESLHSSDGTAVYRTVRTVV